MSCQIFISPEITLDSYFRHGSLGLAFLLCPDAYGGFHSGEEKEEKINPEHKGGIFS